MLNDGYGDRLSKVILENEIEIKIGSSEYDNIIDFASNEAYLAIKTLQDELIKLKRETNNCPMCKIRREEQKECLR